MTIQAKYTHTNLIAQDWRQLAQFYIEVLGCELVPPERDLRGDPVERGTAIPGIHLSGVHLRLPGGDANGPTLEIFSYEPMAETQAKRVNQPGFGHIAFAVTDIEAARTEILAHGGHAVGELVKTPIGDTGHFYRWCYLTDPEGNILELQVKE
jgi:predicted enzyme related to lactoylglutathione lyase